MNMACHSKPNERHLLPSFTRFPVVALLAGPFHCWFVMALLDSEREVEPRGRQPFLEGLYV